MRLLNRIWSTLCKMATNDPSEDELSIPRASMNKMIKEVLPRIRVANESRELILNCCKEFILLVSSEANAVCNEQNRRTINPDHVLTGLDKLGFSDYRQAVEEVARQCKDITAKRRRQSTRLENLGIPEEELLRQQQELFARARHEQMLADQQHLQQISQLQTDAEMHAAMRSAMVHSSDEDDDYS
ncbi:protein Dr1-like isoform X1 [Amphibalanus amphitrite]|uniref:protein Dr1-like isoform X1 n=1 Tax=Amphibalanus amphitrite TaxID=1232801 RepID=UPI001C8FC977|nr:protein Dr1-like isoform X1 [Amphibalanus amphitrite]XP_043231707.1 protein Dr1-like isoform X1 [Amphibalanus amphitrite]